jgi:recombinational DNA repair ATPase RecF
MAEYLKQYKRALKIFERTEDLRNHLLNHQKLYGALEPVDQVRLAFLSKRLTRVGAEVEFWRFFKLLYPYKGTTEYIARESRPYPLAVDLIGHLVIR